MIPRLVAGIEPHDSRSRHGLTAAVAALHRDIELLADFVGADLDALRLLDSVGDHEPSTWDECVALGLDPTTCTPTDERAGQ